MLSRMHVLSFVIAGALAAVAQAQFAPPSQGGPASGNDAGNSAAAPGGGSSGGGGGALSLVPPGAPTNPEVSGLNPLAPKDNTPLKPLRANVSMTADAMIGFVNAQPIFLNDIFGPIDGQLRSLASRSPTLADFREGASVIISNELREQITESVEVTTQEGMLNDDDRHRIDTYLAIQKSKLISKYGGSIPAADRALAAINSSVDKQMAEARRQAIKELYFQKNLLPHIVVTRQMELDAYEKDPSHWQVPETVEMYTITLDITRWLRMPTDNGKLGPVMANPTAEQIKNAEHEALTTANEIEAKLRAGADFAKLVEDYDSDDEARTAGGRTAQHKRGSKSDTKFEDYVFSQPANTLAPPLLLHQPDFRDSAVVVIKIGKKSPARTIPFTEAQEQLALDLKQAQVIELQIQNRDKLLKGSAIEAVDRMLPVAVDAAVTRYATGTSR